MISFFSISALGFFLGMRHATDPDHVIAVTTIVSRQREVKYGAMIGAIWGVGHTLTILFVGSAIILFNVAIPPQLGLAMEVSVGVMLILLGMLNISGVLSPIIVSLQSADKSRLQGSHIHLPRMHRHITQKVDDPIAEQPVGAINSLLNRSGLGAILRPLAVGIVHGLAGSAAVALLVLTTIRSPYGAVAYLLVFGIGTIAGMMLITALIAVPFALSDTRFTRLNHGLGILSSLASLCFGTLVVYQMGFVGGLFSGVPKWVPR